MNHVLLVKEKYGEDAGAENDSSSSESEDEEATVKDTGCHGNTRVVSLIGLSGSYSEEQSRIFEDPFSDQSKGLPSHRPILSFLSLRK